MAICLGIALFGLGLAIFITVPITKSIDGFVCGIILIVAGSAFIAYWLENNVAKPLREMSRENTQEQEA